MKNKKIYFLFCLIGFVSLAFGVINFEVGGISSKPLALAVSLSITLGIIILFYGVGGFFSQRKKATVIKHRKTKNKVKIPKRSKANLTTSDLMRREISLFKLKEDAEATLFGLNEEILKVQRDISKKGFKSTKDGLWVLS